MTWLRILLCTGLLAACGSDQSVESSSPDPRAERAAPWQQLEDPPLSARSGATIAWTGEEILVVGGSTFLCPPGGDCAGPSDPPFRDGALLDPVARSWRPIADAPMPVPPQQPTAHLGGDAYVLVTAWTNDENAVLLRYRSSDDRWTSFDVPSSTQPSDMLAAGDDRLVLYPGSHERGETPDLWFDTSDESWSELPVDPLSPSFDRRYVWAGERLHLFAHDLVPSPGGASGPSLVHAAVLDDPAWRVLPTGDTIGFWSAIADGNRIVAPDRGCADGGTTNGYGRCIPFGAVFDTTAETWSELPGPSSTDADATSGAFTEDGVLLTGLGRPILDLTTDTWVEMPDIDDADDSATVQRTISGAGPYGIVVGGSRFESGSFEGMLLGDAWIWSRDGRR